MLSRKEINEYCQEEYGISIESKIEELINPYLNNNNKLIDGKFNLCVYEITDTLNNLVYRAPLTIDETTFFNIINSIVVNEIKLRWYDKKEKKDKLIEDINVHINNDYYDDYGYDKYDPFRD